MSQLPIEWQPMKAQPLGKPFEHVEHHFQRFAGLIRHAVAGKVLELHYRLEYALDQKKIISAPYTGNTLINMTQNAYALHHWRDQRRKLWREALVRKFQLQID